MQEKAGAQQSEAEENKSVNEKSKDNTNSSVKELASAEHTESSEDESGDEDSDTKNDSGDSEVRNAHITVIHATRQVTSV